MREVRIGRGGGTLGFQVTGIVEGFLGFESFDLGIFRGGSAKLWQVFFQCFYFSRYII